MEINKNVFKWYLYCVITTGVGAGIVISNMLSKYYSTYMLGNIITFIGIILILYMQLKYKLNKKLQ